MGKTIFVRRSDDDDAVGKEEMVELRGVLVNLWSWRNEYNESEGACTLG